MGKEDCARVKKTDGLKKAKVKAKAKAKPRKSKSKPKAKPKATPRPETKPKANAAPMLAPIFAQPVVVTPPSTIKEDKNVVASLTKTKAPSENKKCRIPSKVRTDVWNTFIGPTISNHKCLCCLKTTISVFDFQVGHVLSEHDGGNLNIDNLRPICASCNISMGTTNMKDYVVKYGYLI